MLTRLKDNHGSSEHDVREERRRSGRKSTLWKRRSSLFSQASAVEGRDDGAEDEPSPPPVAVNEAAADSNWLKICNPSDGTQNLEKFVQSSPPGSPTDVMDLDRLEVDEKRDKKHNVEGLREIAKRLAFENPRAYTEVEEKQLEEMSRRITLGESVRSSVTEKQVLKKISRNSASSAPGDIGGAADAVPDWDVKPPVDSPSNSSPRQRAKKIFSKADLGSILPQVKDSSKSEKIFSSPKRQSLAMRMSPKKKRGSKNESTSEEALDQDVPSLAPCQGFLTPSDNLAMRSSEHDPFPHQIDIPKASDVLRHARLCHVLDQYHSIDQNFDFASLVGKSPKGLKKFATGYDLDGLVPLQRPIVAGMIESARDMVLEGYFGAKGDSDLKMEVAIFNSQELRQFIVVYRGSSKQQRKPVRSKLQPMKLAPEQLAAVYPPFRESYFESKLESEVFGLLDKLSEQYPFCDVVMTGHSHGAAIATIAAARFAVSRSMIRVSCQVFGSPKVGDASFRQLVNSLPNLKVFRVEHETDQVVSLPEGSSWTHGGHTVSVNPDLKPIAVAFKFEKNKPTARYALGSIKPDKATKMREYVKVMVQCTNLRNMWMKDYVNEHVGNGVRGDNDEQREVV